MTVKDTWGYRRNRKGEEVFRPVWDFGLPYKYSVGEWRSFEEMTEFVRYCPNMAYIESRVT